MIKRLHIENYKALRDVTLELTPVHVLIGPNDTGKTSILNALAALSRSAEIRLDRAFVGAWDGAELVWQGEAESIVRLTSTLTIENEQLLYYQAFRFPHSGRAVSIEKEKIVVAGSEQDVVIQRHHATRVFEIFCNNNQSVSAEFMDACRLVYKAIAGTHYYRWIPRHLALPVAPDPKRRFRMNADGFGLALYLDDVLGFDRKRFDQLENRFCSIFPEIASIKLIPQAAFRSPADEAEQVSKLEGAYGKGLYFELRGNRQLVPASQASDGVLLVLAYLALLFSPDPPRLVLVEEPENGIHPKRLREVLGILRQLVAEQSQTQVVLTTHSPYAVDLFQPEEVTLCTKQADGSVKLTRMSDSETVRDQLSIFSLGEIWTAEGDEDLSKSVVASPSL